MPVATMTILRLLMLLGLPLAGPAMVEMSSSTSVANHVPGAPEQGRPCNWQMVDVGVCR